jgi:hypothetical protein
VRGLWAARGTAPRVCYHRPLVVARRGIHPCHPFTSLRTHAGWHPHDARPVALSTRSSSAACGGGPTAGVVAHPSNDYILVSGTHGKIVLITADLAEACISACGRVPQSTAEYRRVPQSTAEYRRPHRGARRRRTHPRVCIGPAAGPCPERVRVLGSPLPHLHRDGASCGGAFVLVW